jgi:hypothetical protein
MNFPQTKDNVDIQKGMSLLFAVVFGFGAAAELIWPGTMPITVDEKSVGPQDGLAYYGTLGAGILIGLAGLALFWWLHRRVRRVIASELNLQILIEPVRLIAWSEILSVRKELPNLLNGFYLFSLTDGTTFYTPIEREPPSFSTLMTWYEAPTSLEQICRKKGVWVQ